MSKRILWPAGVSHIIVYTKCNVHAIISLDVCCTHSMFSSANVLIKEGMSTVLDLKYAKLSSFLYMGTGAVAGSLLSIILWINSNWVALSWENCHKLWKPVMVCSSILSSTVDRSFKADTSSFWYFSQSRLSHHHCNIPCSRHRSKACQNKKNIDIMM